MHVMFTILAIVCMYLACWFESVANWSLWWSAPTIVVIIASGLTSIVLAAVKWTELNGTVDEHDR